MAIQYDYGDQYPPDPPEDEWGPLQEEADPLNTFHGIVDGSLKSIMIPMSKKLAEDIQAIRKAFVPINEALMAADLQQMAAIEAAARRRDERGRPLDKP